MGNFKILFLDIDDAALIEVASNIDSRGSFSRFFCDQELNQLLKGSQIVNINHSYSTKKGTLRGMHFQKFPYQEKKFVRCIGGRIYDVIVDLRSDSATYLKWYGVELSSENKKMIYIPEGFAHGYQTLEDNSEIIYCVSTYYSPDAESGLRYNDSSLQIKWPLEVSEISEKDLSFPNFTVI